MGDYRNYEVDGVKMYKSDFNINWIFKHLGRTPNVIMEFGSYDGGDGVFYKKTFPDAEVYSIEACDERYKVIQKLDEIFGIHTFNYAIWRTIVLVSGFTLLMNFIVYLLNK